MSAPKSCCNPCPDVQTENIPGPEGEAGTPGTDGENGISSFTFTTANFNLPGSIGSNVTFSVAASAAFGIGQNIFVTDGTNFGTLKVISLPSATNIEGQWLGYPNDAVAGTQINSGAKVTTGGLLPTLPVGIAEGGSGATTKATAQAAYGLGQDATITNHIGLGYDITAPTPATITGMTAQAPAAGLYLIEAWAAVEFRGTTFAGSRTVTLKTRNTTAGADISSAAKTTGITTTTGYPTLDWHTPRVTVHLDAGDDVALQIGMDVVESAGTSKVEEASLALIPLALD